MSVLRTLAEKGDWVEIDPPEDSGSDNTIGYYDGEPINIGFQTGDDVSDNEAVEVYRSGPYTVEVRGDNGTRSVRVGQKSIEERTFTTKLMNNEKGYYELSLPAALVRHVGYDEVDERSEREVTQGDETVTQDVKKGVHVAIELECSDSQVGMKVRRADEDEYDRSNVRRVQRKPVQQTYEQYYIYFPNTLAVCLGLDGAEFSWQVTDDGEGLNANIIGASCLDFTNAECNDEEYDDLKDEDKCLHIDFHGPNSQPRVVLRTNQSRTLGYLDEDVRRNILQNQEKVTFLAECGPDGYTIVAHTAPEKLDEERRNNRNTVSVGINNWFSTYEGEGEEPVESKMDRAGKQVVWNFPKELVTALGIENEAVYWYPVEDNFYDTGETILVGKPISTLDKEIDLD